MNQGGEADAEGFVMSPARSRKGSELRDSMRELSKADAIARY